jgi:drug/metabolite transporter (DMT)-like permease
VEGWNLRTSSKTISQPTAGKSAVGFSFCQSPAAAGRKNMKIERTESGNGPSADRGAEFPRDNPPRWQVMTAFAAIYLIWGSTYLAIRYGVETIPPFLMAGTRFVTAGLLLYGFARWRGAPAPGRSEWRDATIAGGLMLMIGNGGVTWAELVVPSGVTALLVALVPLWMVLLDWLRPGGIRPRPLVVGGLAVGFAGVALLAGSPANDTGPGYGWGVAALMVAAMCWALGSLFGRHAHKPGSPLLAIAMQMIAGGGLLLLLAGLHGEATAFSFSRLSAASVGAWFYLTAMGSLIGFTSYVWLLRVCTPAKVATYAYVNPLIAVLLGCTIGREPFSHELLAAGGLIVAAVVLIVRSSRVSLVSNGRRAPVETKPCAGMESR